MVTFKEIMVTALMVVQVLSLLPGTLYAKIGRGQQTASSQSTALPWHNNFFTSSTNSGTSSSSAISDRTSAAVPQKGEVSLASSPEDSSSNLGWLNNLNSNPLHVAACTLAAVSVWAWLWSRSGSTSSEQTTIREARKVLNDSTKMCNRGYETPLDGIGVPWQHVASASAEQVKKALTQYMASSSRDANAVVQECNHDENLLCIHIENLKKIATEFDGYSTEASRQHGGSYASLVNGGKSKAESEDLDQRSWHPDTSRRVDMNVKNLVKKSSSWYASLARVVVPCIAGYFAGNYLAGSMGVKVGLGYGIITGMSWWLTESGESGTKGEATELCWQAIKKLERVKYIRSIAAQMDGSTGHCIPARVIAK